MFNLIVSVSVVKVFIPTHAGQTNLWVHSLQTAIAAQRLCIVGHCNVVHPDLAYLGGLLHDIGRFMMFRESTDILETVDGLGWHSGDELVEAERKITGTDHAVLGWQACSAWHLPEIIGTMIKDHHGHDIPADYGRDAERVELLRIVRIADRLSILLISDPELIAGEKETVTALLEEACLIEKSDYLTAEMIYEELETILEQSDKATQALGIVH